MSLGTSLDFRPSFRRPKPPKKKRHTVFDNPNISLNSPLNSLKSTLKKKIPSMKPSQMRKSNFMKGLTNQHKNWRSQNKSRKEVQNSYNRQKKEIEREANKRSVKIWFKPRVIHHKNILENHRASISNLRKKSMIADVNLIPEDSEYKKIKRIEENLKTFKKRQSKNLETLYKKLSLSQKELISNTTIMNKNKNKNILLIFETFTEYNNIIYNVENDIPLSETDKAKLNKYYISMKDSVNEYILSFIEYICKCLEYNIFELLWGFCLPNHLMTNNEHVLHVYNRNDKNISLLEDNLKEFKKRHENDSDYEPHNLENLKSLYENLKKIHKIKLNGKTKWNGEYLTEDEIYRYFIDTVPAIILIDELEAYITPIIHTFPYDGTTPLESEILKSVLLLKIKENQPGTIHIDNNMVMPQNYWTVATPVPEPQGSRF